MSRMKVYLAGPEVFLPGAVSIGAEKKRLCEEYGFEGLFPFDNEIPEGEKENAIDRAIYAANIAMIKTADLGIFNLTPFRGVSADVGTVFELGMMVGLAKPVFAYSNDKRNLLERVAKIYPLQYNVERQAWTDNLDMSVENFGNSDNLMIDAALASQGRRIHLSSLDGIEDPCRHLTGFIACLGEAQTWFRQFAQRRRASA